MINSDKIIGIMGGTFNPIHKGHTGIARCAYEQSDIDEILFMPSGTPAYKDNSPIVSATDRCNMVKLAIKPFDYMSLSTIETDRPGNTYTADTLAQIYDSYKKIYFIISILLIIIVLLQSSKAEGGAQILSGNTTDLFKNRKERGAELVVTRITMVLGLAFFVICLIESFL